MNEQGPVFKKGLAVLERWSEGLPIDPDEERFLHTFLLVRCAEELEHICGYVQNPLDVVPEGG